jgi:hypothetical protein
MASHLRAFKDSPRKGILTNRPTRTMNLLHAMCGAETRKVMSFHNARITSPLSGPNNIHKPFSLKRTHSKNITNRSPTYATLPNRHRRLAPSANQRDTSHRNAKHRRTQLDNLPTLRPRSKTTRLLTKGNLHSLITIRQPSLNTKNPAWTSLHKRNRQCSATRANDLRHTNLTAQQKHHSPASLRQSTTAQLTMQGRRLNLNINTSRQRKPIQCVDRFPSWLHNIN